MKPFRGKRNQPAEPALDVILKVLTAAHAARPDAAFITSLLQQYRERGGLSKKQLEGLHAKASRIEGIPTGHLATLQAIIMKKNTRYKSDKPEAKEIQQEEEEIPLINTILEKYPLHKQVLFFKTKRESGQQLSPTEKEELKRFYRLLIKS
ncbi:MAG: hypothetical protein QM687_00890 [Ferruginibacter sp.]